MSRQEEKLHRHHEQHIDQDHEEEYGCGHEHHEHAHHHEHHEHHGHAHHHDHGEGCGCGHVHHHEESPQDIREMPAGITHRTYILENLGCANCAAKMERKINALPEVEAAAITFATKKLVVASDHQKNLLPKLQKICASIESEVIVVPKEVKEAKKKRKARIF